MAWYTSIDNCTNKARLAKSHEEQILSGDTAFAALAAQLVHDARNLGRQLAVAIDGYKGARFAAFLAQLVRELEEKGAVVEQLCSSRFFLSAERISEIFADSERPFDPSFGRVYEGAIDDLIDRKALTALRGRPSPHSPSSQAPRILIWYGIGSLLAELEFPLDRTFYLDVTREQIMVRADAGALELVGGTLAQGFPWKRIYYAEYPVLNRHKKNVLSRIDWYVDDSVASPVFVPAPVYHDIILSLSGQPISLKVFYMPGPFGGHEFGRRFQVSGLPNTSWDYEISIGDNHMIVDVGDHRLEVPLYNLIWEQPLRVLGSYSQAKYPDHFPIAIYMQDGYFPPGDEAGFKRTHMPHHLHPDSAYCREHFNEPLGRYETYYIVRADPGAVTMHGFRDEADIDEYLSEVKRSAETGEEFSWQRFIYEHPSKTGELHQLPPGTVHGTGGRQLILEIDTNPSRESTEYSLYLYDYCRPNFNYQTNEMTGPPLKLTLDHSLAQLSRNRRQDFMATKCRPAPVCVREGQDWREVSFPMCDDMPYQVNRFEFASFIRDCTDGMFHCLSLTAGTRVRVASQGEPANAFIMEDCDTIILPAAFGHYVCENLAGGHCEIVKTTLRVDF